MYILGFVLVLLLWALIWNTNYQGIKEQINVNEDAIIFSLIILASAVIWPFTLPMMVIFVLIKETK